MLTERESLLMVFTVVAGWENEGAVLAGSCGRRWGRWKREREAKPEKGESFGSLVLFFGQGQGGGSHP